MKDWLHVEGVFAVFLAPALRHCFEWLHLGVTPFFAWAVESEIVNIYNVLN